MAFHAIRGCRHQFSWDTKHEAVADESGCDAKRHYGKRKDIIARNSRKVSLIKNVTI